MGFVRVGFAGLWGAAAVLSAGAGSGAAPDAGAPDAAAPEAGAAGSSSADTSERVLVELKRHVGEIDRCYARTLARDPCARGSLNVRVDVQPDGRVAARADEAPGALAELGACVTQAMGTWRMPAGPGVSYARLRFPLTFEPPAPAPPEQSCGARILDQAPYHGSQLPPVDRGRWWSVCDGGNGFDVRPVRLSVKSFRDEMAEDGPRQKTGREVVVDGCAHPAFLVQGVYGAATGPLPKARFETKGEWAGRTAEIALDAVTYQLRFEGAEDGPWRIVLAGLGAPAVILSGGSYSAPSAWSVRWAGDLDGDKHPDFVIEETTESGSTILHLFVSRSAPRGADVRQLAETTHGGC